MTSVPSVAAVLNSPDLQVAEPDRTARRMQHSMRTSLLVPAVVYLAARAVGVAVLAWMAPQHATDLATVMAKWDGQWLLGIAQFGYDGVSADLTDARGLREPSTSLAFFPGFSALLAAVRLAVPFVGHLEAAVGVNAVLGVIAAVGTARLGTRITGSSRAGLWLVLLLAAAPMGLVLSLAYSEALFCALATWALVGLLERRWLLVGFATAAAGVVRPTAAALVLVVGIAALAAVAARRDGWRPWVAGLLAPTGLVAYLGWVGYRTGTWNGWFTLQSQGWNSGFDGGVATWNYTYDVVSVGRVAFEVAAAAILAGSLILLALSIKLRVPWPVWVYGAGVTLMVVASSGVMTSKPRLLLPAFVLTLPIAIGMAKRRNSTQLAVAVGVVLVSGWFGAYTLTNYAFAI